MEEDWIKITERMEQGCYFMVKVDPYLHYQRSLHMDYEYTSLAIADYEEIF